MRQTVPQNVIEEEIETSIDVWQKIKINSMAYPLKK